MLTSCCLIQLRLVIYSFCFAFAHKIIQAVRPKLEMAKTIEEAAIAVDEMFSSAFHSAGGAIYHFCSRIIYQRLLTVLGDDSGEDSGDEDKRPEGNERDDEEEEDLSSQDSPVSKRNFDRRSLTQDL
jgi:regulator of nonsense transcripts 2